MLINTDLNLQMTQLQQQACSASLRRDLPVAVLLEGLAFDIFTRDFEKPFDQVMIHSMRQTLRFLCRNIPGCRLGYTHGNRLLLVLQPSDPTAPAYCDYNVQKLCSTLTGIATMKFNKTFEDMAKKYTADIGAGNKTTTIVRASGYINAVLNGAVFCCSCMNVPADQVSSYLFWQQQIAIEDSIQSVADYYFPREEWQGKTVDQLDALLRLKKDVHWNEYSAPLKWGTACYRDDTQPEGWFLDPFMPLLTPDQSPYVDRWLSEQM